MAAGKGLGAFIWRLIGSQAAIAGKPAPTLDWDRQLEIGRLSGRRGGKPALTMIAYLRPTGRVSARLAFDLKAPSAG
ncbi:hypothetical protein GCM10009103_49660 [Pseudomonas koreensis]|nr:hypothetical protein GCM10009103_49660 [Pseudomonas koreensis]